MPTRPPAPLASTASPQVGVYRHLAFVRCLTRSSIPGDDLWLTACYHLTPSLQRFGHDAALLDLGPCTEQEAVAVMQALLTHLRDQQVAARAGIGPTSLLAQLALLQALSAHQPLALVTPEQTRDLLPQLPIVALARLRLAAPPVITPEIVAKLEGYGVRTLAHLARLDEEQLRRQFGARLGKLLATMARGDDVLPFQPTPAPLRLHFRLRLTTAVSPNRLLIGLPPFASEVATALARRGVQARMLELRLRWEAGRTERITRTLPQPIADGRTLAETMERLLAPVFQADATSQQVIEDLRLILSDLSPRYPEQHAFWPQRIQRLAAAREVADVLARRHGKPLLFHGSLTEPDAILDQNRSRLAPVDADAADVREPRTNGEAWPTTDVADAEEAIPHGIHWW